MGGEGDAEGDDVEVDNGVKGRGHHDCFQRNHAEDHEADKLSHRVGIWPPDRDHMQEGHKEEGTRSSVDVAYTCWSSLSQRTSDSRLYETGREIFE